MRIVFSRKGFDSAAGGGPSPIVDGRPVSLPIPANNNPSATTYGQLGLGELAAKASRGRLGDKDNCHHDPMFLADEQAMLGQCGAAQTHLARHGVGEGDLFVFFGLFQGHNEARHHRIFGWLEVSECLNLADAPARQVARLKKLGFPHALGLHARNDCVYSGRGGTARLASDFLRLSVTEGPPSLWQVPAWLSETGLSYHAREERWLPGNRLQSVARGQEFVADIGERDDARRWAKRIIAEMRGEDTGP